MQKKKNRRPRTDVAALAITVVGHASSPDQFVLFLDGYLDALIVQDPFQMGYRGVYAMDQVVHKQPVKDKLVAIPAKVVTLKNISQPDIYDLLASYGDIKSILEDKKIKRGQ